MGATCVPGNPTNLEKPTVKPKKSVGNNSRKFEASREHKVLHTNFAHELLDKNEDSETKKR